MLYLRVTGIRGEMSDRQFDLNVKLGERLELGVRKRQCFKLSVGEITKECTYSTKNSGPRTTENIHF